MLTDLKLSDRSVLIDALLILILSGGKSQRKWSFIAMKNYSDYMRKNLLSQKKEESSLHPDIKSL